MVRDDGVSSVPVDPLAGCSSFSLFPLSFHLARPSSTLDDPNPNFDLHSHLQAMVSRSPDELLEQAKTILGDNMEPNKTSVMTLDGKAEKVSSVNDTNPQTKRPALGLKPAKFSVKPMSSQPDVIPEPSIDIDKLKDPVEFFAAFERMENAKKELQRLRGQPLINLDQNRSPLSPRRRRPSLYEKSATYKHHSYSSTRVSDNGETFPSSQETFEEHIVSPTRQDTLPETDILDNPQHFRVSDSSPAMTSEPNELDELLSCDYGGLDEAGVLDLLQDKLQIKLRDFGKPAPLDVLDVQRRESETSCDALPKMTDAIARLNGVRKAAGSKHLSLSSQLRDSSVHPRVSPVQPKSPLASLSLLNRHISKISPSKDPFSALDIDSSPTGRPSKTVRGKESDRFCIIKNIDESQTSLEHGEEICAVSNTPPVSDENITAQRSEPEEQLDGVRQSDQDGVRKDLHKQQSSAAIGEEIAAGSSVFSPSFVAKDMSSNSEPKEWMDGATESSHVVTRTDLCDFRRSPVHEDQCAADFGEDPLVSAARGINPRSENKQQEDEVGAARNSVQQELNIEGSTTQKPSANGVDECITSEALNTEDTDIQEYNEEAVGPSKKKLTKRRSKVASKRDASKEIAKEGEKLNTQSGVPGVPVSDITGIKKRKAEGDLQSSKREHLNRRTSLYGAGTKWEDGVRRSTRIKMRPLEYWRGERFLYGRVHDSLVTVIGVKYSSPSKEAEQPPVKVKSFVSDQFKELVDLAALH